MAGKEDTKLISDIIAGVGGTENITGFFHCLTRLRFNVADAKKVDEEGLKNHSKTLGAQWKGNQFQVIIGTQAERLYNDIRSQYGIGTSDNAVNNGERKKLTPAALLTFMADCLVPALPAIIGGGLLKGFLILFTTYNLMDNGSDFYYILNTISDAPFYFLPVLVGYTAAKKLEVNILYALTIAGILMHTNLLNFAGETKYIFGGLPIQLVKYSSSVVPVMLSILALKYIYKGVHKIVPDVLRTILAPLLIMIIAGLVTLGITAPIGYYVGLGLASIVNWMFEVSPALAGAVYGGARQFVVLTGMHMSLTTIIYANMDLYGFDILMPIHAVSTLSVAGACFGAIFRAKSKDVKGMGLSAGISAVCGITEPGIYAIMLRFKKPFIASCVASVIGGGIVAALGGHCYTVATPSLISIGIFGDTMGIVGLGMAIAFVIAMVLTIVLGFDEKLEKNERAIKAESKVVIKTRKDSLNIVAPVTGSVVKLEQINDAVIAGGILGQGCGIIPEDNQILAPASGQIVTVTDTQHGIGMITDEGVEMFLHIGLETVELKGKHFDIRVKNGDRVKAGDSIGSVDFPAVKAAGYDTVTVVIVSDLKGYKEIKSVKTGRVQASEELFTIN